MTRYSVLLITFLVLLLPSPGARAEQRFALAIGNARYSQDLGALATPLLNASVMAEALKSVNFSVTTILDGNRVEMYRGLDAILKQAKESSRPVVFIYFSGHGFSVGGEDYLLPIDVNPFTGKDPIAQAVKIRELMNLVDEAVPSGTKFLVVDSFSTDVMLKGTRAVLPDRGLKRIESGSLNNQNWMVVLATAPGSTVGGPSPFAAAFSKHVTTEGIEARHLLTRIRAEVIAATGRAIAFGGAA